MQPATAREGKRGKDGKRLPLPPMGEREEETLLNMEPAKKIERGGGKKSGGVRLGEKKGTAPGAAIEKGDSLSGFFHWQQNIESAARGREKGGKRKL